MVINFMSWMNKRHCHEKLRGLPSFSDQSSKFKKIILRIQGFKDSNQFYLQQRIHFATVLINKTYSTITRQIEITNNHYNNQNYECVIAQYNLN